MKKSVFFADRLREAYRDFEKSLVPGGKEHDIRMRFIQHVVWKGFGYPERCVINEKNRSDIWLLDKEVTKKKKRQVFPIMVIETKDFNRVKDRALLSKTNRNQTFSYIVSGSTRYVALTNFRRFILWRVENPDKPIADLNLHAEVFTVPLISQINDLIQISYEEISRVYDDFTLSNIIDLADSSNFEDFTSLVKWKLFDELLIPQFRRLAENLCKKYESYEFEKEKIEKLKNKFIEGSKKNSSEWQNVVDLEHQLRMLIQANIDSIKFNDCYTKWQKIVYPPNDKTKPEERFERFIKETAYTMLSRIILVRMGEDLSEGKTANEIILPQKISNGGLITMLNLITQVNEAFKKILKFAFEDAKPIYRRLFIEGVYDWYWEGDGELNYVLKKVLWHLNQYNFAGIERDTFKNIYQYHMDRVERRKIGEYYTPDEVVHYILNRIEYKEDRELRGLRILDPGSGSGTFILEAALRLRNQLNKCGLSSKETIYAIAGKPDTKREFGHIFGFDINPFAVYLSESNFLLHFMKEIQSARIEPGFILDKFQIYRTNTLELPIKNRRLDVIISGIPLEEEEINLVKSLKFDFIVGNPPYVRTHRLTKNERKAINKNLKDKFPKILGKEDLSTRQLDLYIVFTAYAISWLKNGGYFSFILSGKFLTSENGEWLRRLILDTCTIEEIVDVMRVKEIFKTQDVYPIILVLRLEPDIDKRRKNNIKIKVVLKDKITLLNTVQDIECLSDPQYASINSFLAYTIPQKLFDENPREEFQIYTSNKLKPIRDKIGDPKSTIPLGNILLIERGVERGGNEKWASRLETLNLEYYGKNFIFKTADFSNFQHADKSLLKKVIDGNSIGEFIPEWNNEYLCYDIEWLNNPRNPDLFEEEKKLIIPRRAMFLKTTIDFDKFYILDDVYTGHIKHDSVYKPNLKYLLGLLNSSVIDFYHKIRHMTRLQGDWFDYYDYTLSTLPIKKIDSKEEMKIIKLIDKIIQNKRKTATNKNILGNINTIIESSKVSTCRVGLSRLITKREGGDEKIDKIKQKRKVLIFNRYKTMKIECISEEAAIFIKELLNEQFEKIKNKKLSNVLIELKLPEDELSLKTVLNHRNKLRNRIKKLQNRYNKLKQNLDTEIAHLYGLNEKEYILMKQAQNLISTTLE